MKYVVHLRQKRHGKIEVEAESSMDAMSKVKRLVHEDVDNSDAGKITGV